MQNVENTSQINPAPRWSVTLALCLFFGCFGAHRFYTGRVVSASAILFLSLMTFGIFGTIVSLLDLVGILSGKFTDKDGRGLVGVWGHEEALSPEAMKEIRTVFISRIIALAGATLVAIGVILIVKMNWGCFDSLWRAIIVTAPTAVCLIAALVIRVRAKKSPFSWGLLAFVWIVALHFAAFMLREIYQVEISGGEFLAVIYAALTIIALFLPTFISLLSLTIYPFLWYLCEYPTRFAAGGLSIAAVIAVAALCAFMLVYSTYFKRYIGKASAFLLEIVTALAFSLGIGGIIATLVHKKFAVALNIEDMRFVMVFWAMASAVAFGGLLRKAEVWRDFGIGVLLLALLPVIGHGSEISYYCALAIAVGVIVLGLVAKRDRYVKAASLIALMVALGRYGMNSLMIEFALALGVSAAVVIAGAIRLSLGMVNIAMMVIIVLTGHKILGSDMAIDKKALVAVGMGLLLLVANELTRRLRKRSEAKNPKICE